MKGNLFLVSQKYEKHYLVGRDTVLSDKYLRYVCVLRNVVNNFSASTL